MYFNSFMSAERSGIDVLLCDEAHRIRETSVNRFTPRAKREAGAGRPQIDELMAAARVPVFLLDEHQVVKPGELGSVDVISTYAQPLGGWAASTRPRASSTTGRASSLALTWSHATGGGSPGGVSRRIRPSGARGAERRRGGPVDPQHLQGIDDSRHARHDALLDGPRNQGQSGVAGARAPLARDGVRADRPWRLRAADLRERAACHSGPVDVADPACSTRPPVSSA